MTANLTNTQKKTNYTYQSLRWGTERWNSEAEVEVKAEEGVIVEVATEDILGTTTGFTTIATPEVPEVPPNREH